MSKISRHDAFKIKHAALPQHLRSFKEQDFWVSGNGNPNRTSKVRCGRGCKVISLQAVKAIENMCLLSLLCVWSSAQSCFLLQTSTLLPEDHRFSSQKVDSQISWARCLSSSFCFPKVFCQQIHVRSARHSLFSM